VFFLWGKILNAKYIHNEMFRVYGGKSLTHEAVHDWVEKFSLGHKKVADDAGPGRFVEIAGEETAQQVEELIRVDRRITIV
jgi:hypothetical protein